MMTIRAQRIMLWWSIAFMILYGIAFMGLLGMVPFPNASMTVDQTAAFYVDNNLKIRLGAVVASWSSGFLVPFAVVVGVQLARLERGVPIWAILSVIGGAMMTIFLVLPPIFWGVAAFTPGRPPEVTMAIHELANLTFITTSQYYIFQFVAIAYVSLTQKVDPNSPFPRWFGYLTIWAIFMFELAAIAYLTRTGPFAWHGLFAFWFPVGIFFTWLPILLFRLFAALKRQEAQAD